MRDVGRCRTLWEVLDSRVRNLVVFLTYKRMMLFVSDLVKTLSLTCGCTSGALLLRKVGHRDLIIGILPETQTAEELAVMITSIILTKFVVQPHQGMRTYRDLVLFSAAQER